MLRFPVRLGLPSVSISTLEMANFLNLTDLVSAGSPASIADIGCRKTADAFNFEPLSYRPGRKIPGDSMSLGQEFMGLCGIRGRRKQIVNNCRVEFICS